MKTVYNVMYELTSTISIGVGTNTDPTVMAISPSDIVSVAILHRYDTSTYPIIRLRLYADMSLVELINEDPDNIYAGISAIGAIYQIDEETQSTTRVQAADTISIYGRAYMEHKNIPVSKMDQYKDGSRDTDDLNVDSKVPFELYIYDDTLIHAMRQKTQAVYRNMTVGTACEDILVRAGLAKNQIVIDPIQNQKRYDQILIPNLRAVEAFSYFDHMYGLYPHGGMLYYDNTISPPTMFLCDTQASRTAATNVPIYIRTEKQDSNDGGMTRVSYDGKVYYAMQTGAINASVITEADIERVMNPEIMSDINLVNLDSHHTKLTRLFNTTDIDTLPNRIEQKNRLHKTDRTTLSIQDAARLNEKITRVDLSGVGFPITKFKPNARVNLIFESPIRGLKIGDCYRMRYACHVLTNMTGTLFTPQTTMSLCTN